MAQKWADLMTEKYEQLSVEDPVFGELRNVMDMCVVAALIDRERLLARAGLELPLLTDEDSKLGYDAMQPPKTVPTQCSYMKKGRSYILTASGGVDIDAWGVASQSQVDQQLDQTHQAATRGQDTTWWWN
jgi:hypothetical protein